MWWRYAWMSTGLPNISICTSKPQMIFSLSSIDLCRRKRILLVCFIAFKWAASRLTATSICEFRPPEAFHSSSLHLSWFTFPFHEIKKKLWGRHFGIVRNNQKNMIDMVKAYFLKIVCLKYSKKCDRYLLFWPVADFCTDGGVGHLGHVVAWSLLVQKYNTKRKNVLCCVTIYNLFLLMLKSTKELPGSGSSRCDFLL